MAQYNTSSNPTYRVLVNTTITDVNNQYASTPSDVTYGTPTPIIVDNLSRETNYLIDGKGSIVAADLNFSIPAFTLDTNINYGYAFSVDSGTGSNFKYTTTGITNVFDAVTTQAALPTNASPVLATTSLESTTSMGFNLFYTITQSPSVQTLTFTFDLYKVDSSGSPTTTLLYAASAVVTIEVIASIVTPTLTTHSTTDISLINPVTLFRNQDSIIFITELLATSGTGYENAATITFTQTIPNKVNLDAIAQTNNGYIIVTNSSTYTTLAAAVADTTNNVIIAPGDRLTYGVSITGGTGTVPYSVSFSMPNSTADYANDVFAKILDSTNKLVESPIYVWIVGKIEEPINS